MKTVLMKFRVFDIVIKHSLWCKVQPKPKQSNPLGPNRILGEQKLEKAFVLEQAAPVVTTF